MFTILPDFEPFEPLDYASFQGMCIIKLEDDDDNDGGVKV